MINIIIRRDDANQQKLTITIPPQLLHQLIKTVTPIARNVIQDYPEIPAIHLQ